jgi:hypothetical protein
MEFIDSLKRLYQAGTITVDRLNVMVTKGIITTEERQTVLAQ